MRKKKSDEKRMNRKISVGLYVMSLKLFSGWLNKSEHFERQAVFQNKIKAKELARFEV